jgi:outer membrane beta-barrel protein
MHHRWSRILLSSIFVGFAVDVRAQSQDAGADVESASETTAGDQEVEKLYENFETDERAREAQRRAREEERRAEGSPQRELRDITDLKDLAPFNDIAIIQRKFLPKTRRFEASSSLLLGMNNSFFNNLGADLRLGYYLTEKWGFEILYEAITNSKKQVTKDLEELSVRTTNLITPTGYFGGLVKWSPMYGKIAFMNTTIVPFELYFYLGAGNTTTEEGSSFTTTIGGGQLYALTKGMAFRWDLLAHFYSVALAADATRNLPARDQAQTDLHLTVGMSFFFPGAKYR